jgi:hypothetical protein
MGNSKFSLVFLSLATVLFFAGCAKDQTADEYQNAKMTQDLGKLQARSGTYRGLLLNTGSNKPIGALEIMLQATTDPGASSACATGSSAAGMIGTAILHTTENAHVTFSKVCYFEPDNSSSGTLSAQIDVKVRDGSTSSLAVSGTITGNSFSGLIHSMNRSGPQGSFTLVKDAPLPTHGQGSTYPGIEDNRTYAGTFTDSFCRDNPNGDNCKTRTPGAKPVRMNIVMAAPSSEETFLNYFSDEKDVSISMNMNGAEFLLNPAHVDDADGTIQFEGNVTATTSAPATLDCKSIQGNGYHCTYITTISTVTFDAFFQNTSRPEME